MVVVALAMLGLLAGQGKGALEQAPVGIPRALAVERAARVSGVEYFLSYRLVPHKGTVAATETMRFQLKDAATPLVVDFRDGEVLALGINGNALPGALENGHLVLPASALKVGMNELNVGFTANAGAAEKALTRFDDKDDGNEYIYSLFVPMDADMAFPCFDQPDLKGRFQLQLLAPSKWTVLSNTKPETVENFGDETRTTFGKTEPISTYLFAFAAGPFRKIHPVEGLPGALCASFEGEGGRE